MRRVALLSFLAILAAAAFAAAAPLRPPASATAGSTISGVVSEDLDGDRVLGPGDRGAFGPVIDLERRVDGEVAWVVSLYGDGDGRFAFTDVPPGDYVVVAYWLRLFINPPNRAGNGLPAAEYTLKIEAGRDVGPLTFLVEKGAPSAGPIGTRSPAFPVGTRSVRDVVLPLIPSEPGLTHRVLLGPAVTEVLLTRVRPLGEGHAGRTEQLVCGRFPVVGDVAVVTPRFSYTCPPGSIIIVTTLPILDTRRNFGPTHPPIDWRLPLPGEGARTVTTIIGVGQPSPPEVTPPGTGDGGLKRP